MPPLATKAREKTFCLNSPNPSVVVTALPEIFFNHNILIYMAYVLSLIHI